MAIEVDGGGWPLVTREEAHRLHQAVSPGRVRGHETTVDEAGERPPGHADVGPLRHRLDGSEIERARACEAARAVRPRVARCARGPSGPSASARPGPPDDPCRPAVRWRSKAAPGRRLPPPSSERIGSEPYRSSRRCAPPPCPCGCLHGRSVPGQRATASLRAFEEPLRRPRPHRPASRRQRRTRRRRSRTRSHRNRRRRSS